MRSKQQKTNEQEEEEGKCSLYFICYDNIHIGNEGKEESLDSMSRIYTPTLIHSICDMSVVVPVLFCLSCVVQFKNIHSHSVCVLSSFCLSCVVQWRRTHHYYLSSMITYLLCMYKHYHTLIHMDNPYNTARCMYIIYDL